jgi:hypothetical protein
MKDRKPSDVYRIKIKGHLDSSWSEWFEGLTIANESDETTVLTGIVADQPALHGLLAKVRDLGLQLLLVEYVAAEERCPDEP